MSQHVVINHDLVGLVVDMLKPGSRKVLNALGKTLHNAYGLGGWDAVRKALLVIVESPIESSGNAVQCLVAGLTITIEHVHSIDVAIASCKKGER